MPREVWQHSSAKASKEDWTRRHYQCNNGRRHSRKSRTSRPRARIGGSRHEEGREVNGHRRGWGIKVQQEEETGKRMKRWHLWRPKICSTRRKTLNLTLAADGGLRPLAPATSPRVNITPLKVALIGFADGESKDMGACCQAGQRLKHPPSSEHAAEIQHVLDPECADVGADNSTLDQNLVTTSMLETFDNLAVHSWKSPSLSNSKFQFPGCGLCDVFTPRCLDEARKPSLVGRLWRSTPEEGHIIDWTLDLLVCVRSMRSHPG